MIELKTYTTHIILEKDYPHLRETIGKITSDVEIGFGDYLMWWNEDNTGNIQITNTQDAIGTLEEDIEYIKSNIEDFDFSQEDINNVNDLITVMISASENNITCIEYGV